MAEHPLPARRLGELDSASREDADAYARLLAPDRDRFFVVEQIGGLRPLTVPVIQAAPHTRRMVIGRQ